VSSLYTRGRAQLGNGSLAVIAKGTATYDPSSLADGVGETSADIPATGAAFGDFVLVSAPYNLAGVVVTGYVKAANVISIRVQNESGGLLDLASGAWKYLVLR